MNAVKIFWLFNHPAPYKVDFFNELGRYCDLTAMFERDQEGGRNEEFYSHHANNYTEIRCHALPLGSMNSLSGKPIGHLKKNRYDAIVINGYRSFTEMRTIAYCRRHSIPYVFAINGGIKMEKEGRLAKAIKRKFIAGASAYLCPDEVSADYLVYYGARPERIALFPYSSIFEKEVLKSPLSMKEKKKIRQEFGVEGRHVYVSSGFFIPRKNFGQLIHLWSSMPPEDTLVIAGEGPLQPELESLIAKLNLANVKLLPFLPHEQELRLFSGADAFLFLSREDIYGHVIVEALSQGLPIVSSPRVNAARHLIRPGRNGYLVPLEDEQALLQAFAAVLNPAFPKECLKVARENTIEASAFFHRAYFSSYIKKGPR